MEEIKNQKIYIYLNLLKTNIQKSKKDKKSIKIYNGRNKKLKKKDKVKLS